MPYKRVGKTIMHKKDGWSVKQTASGVENAKKALHLLEGIEHGWTPTGKTTSPAINKHRKDHGLS